VLLAVHTPAPVYPMVRNEQIDELEQQHCYEIVTWPAYFSDEYCMNSLRKNTDPNVILYVALMRGITPIVTIGDHKSFVADFSKPKESKKHSRKLPSRTDKIKKKLEDTFKRKRNA